MYIYMYIMYMYVSALDKNHVCDSEAAYAYKDLEL